MRTKDCPKCDKQIWFYSSFCRKHAFRPTAFKQGHGLSNTGRTHFSKGESPWNKGLQGVQSDERHGGWKGNKVGYYALHAWIKRKLGKAKYCLFAKTLYSDCSPSFQWANISREYKRNLEDWMQLCVRHHKQYDSPRSLI